MDRSSETRTEPGRSRESCSCGVSVGPRVVRSWTGPRSAMPEVLVASAQNATAPGHGDGSAILHSPKATLLPPTAEDCLARAFRHYRADLQVLGSEPFVAQVFAVGLHAAGALSRGLATPCTGSKRRRQAIQAARLSVCATCGRPGLAAAAVAGGQGLGDLPELCGSAEGDRNPSRTRESSVAIHLIRLAPSPIVAFRVARSKPLRSSLSVRGQRVAGVISAGYRGGLTAEHRLPIDDGDLQARPLGCAFDALAPSRTLASSASIWLAWSKPIPSAPSCELPPGQARAGHVDCGVTPEEALLLAVAPGTAGRSRTPRNRRDPSSSVSHIQYMGFLSITIPHSLHVCDKAL